MKLIEIRYFSKSANLCGDDFNNKDKGVKINPIFVASLSDLTSFNLPLSGKYVDSYAILTMSNNDKYCLRENEYNYLCQELTNKDSHENK